jgi:hypothetical protein
MWCTQLQVDADWDTRDKQLVSRLLPISFLLTRDFAMPLSKAIVQGGIDYVTYSSIRWWQVISS